MFVLILVFGARAGRAVRLRARRPTRCIGDRAGVARQANARPARGAVGAARAAWCATATLSEIAVDRRRARRPARAPRRRPGRRPTGSCARRRARGRRVVAHRRVRARSSKDDGDEVLSGSIVVAGSGRFQATQVGADCVRRAGSRPRPAASRSSRSELVDGTNRILQLVQWAIVPDRDPARVQPVQRARLEPRARSRA